MTTLLFLSGHLPVLSMPRLAVALTGTFLAVLVTPIQGVATTLLFFDLKRRTRGGAHARRRHAAAGGRGRRG
jgi:hypothetical protein